MAIEIDHTKKKVFLSLGTNLGDKLENLNLAYGLIEKRVGSFKLKSSVYTTPALGFKSQNLFYNTVVCIETILTAQMLLIEIKAIERYLGREVKVSDEYKDRIIDIDIIDYNGDIVKEKLLNIPHDKMNERSFVLLPLQEIQPKWIHPISNISIEKLVNSLPNITEITQLNEK